MENRKPLEQALRPIEDTDVTTWELPEGTIGRLGQGWLLDVEFSPDGAYLTVSTKIGFWIYDTATMVPRALWGTERGMFNVATFSPDMRWIATGDQDGIVKVWDTQNGQCVRKINWGKTRQWRNSVLHVHFSPDGQHLAASGFGHSVVYDWSTNNETPIASFTIENPKLDDYRKKDADYDRHFPIAFSPDSNLFASVSAPDTVTISDINTGEDIANLTGHTAPVHTLLFSPCGQYLAGANLDATVQVWDIQSGTFIMMPTTYKGNRVRLVYTADGTLWVADLWENKVMIWDASTGENLNEFETLSSCHRASCFSNDGTQFAICNTRGDVQVWKANTLSTEALFSGYKSAAFSVEFLQESRALVSSHWGTTGKVFWDVASRKMQRIFPSLTERSPLRRTVALSPRDEFLAAETGDASIKVWNIASDTLVAELTEHENHVISFSFSPIGKYLVSAGTEGELFVWDVEHWEKQHSLQPSENEGVEPAKWRLGDKKIAFHPDGKQVAAISYNDKARVWDIESGEHLATLPLPEDLEGPIPYKGDLQEIQQPENPMLERSSNPLLRAIAFSSCGTVIACGRENEVILWDTNTSQIRMVIRLPETSWRPYALAFSRSGHYLAVGSWWCGTDSVPIQLWEVATGENVHTFWGHASDIQDLAFSPDGTLLASGSFDGTVLLWDMKPFIGS